MILLLSSVRYPKHLHEQAGEHDESTGDEPPRSPDGSIEIVYLDPDQHMSPAEEDEDEEGKEQNGW